MIRAIIQSVMDTLGNVRRFTASGRPDETITNREMFQHYGFSSSPLPGAEGIVINEGNHYILIATEDRQYRIPIGSGEVCVYTHEGDKIYFQTGKVINISSGNKVVITAANEVDVNAPVINITGAASVTVNAPAITLTGPAAGTTPRSIIDNRIIDLFNNHTHADPGEGDTGVPNQQISAAECATTITEAA